MAMESESQPKRKRGSIVITSIVVAAIVIISATSLVAWWSLGSRSPNMEVQLNTINFYDPVVLPPLPGHVPIQLGIIAINQEDGNVSLDPSDFVVETSDGLLRHFAWRFGNCTIITFPGAELFGVGGELPAGFTGNMWVPYEIPMNVTLVRVIWKSSLGDVTCQVSSYINERLLDFEAGNPA